MDTLLTTFGFWTGDKVTILPNVRIRKNSVIGQNQL
jgi:acetyltransferase-like isoleucine patch superfamily enzyme